MWKVTLSLFHLFFLSLKLSMSTKIFAYNIGSGSLQTALLKLAWQLLDFARRKQPWKIGREEERKKGKKYLFLLSLHLEARLIVVASFLHSQIQTLLLFWWIT